MKNALAEAMSQTQKSSQKGNIFEMVIRSLSQDDEESLNMLKAILVEIDAMDEMVLGIQKRKSALSVTEIAKMLLIRFVFLSTGLLLCS